MVLPASAVLALAHSDSGQATPAPVGPLISGAPAGAGGWAGTFPTAGPGGVLGSNPFASLQAVHSPFLSSRLSTALRPFGAATGAGGVPAWVGRTAQGIASGQIPSRAAYLPNLNLIEHPLSSPSSVISPLYDISPAPMGLGDFGLNTTGAYSVYTPDVRAHLALSGYNATAGSLYEDTGAYYWNGLSPNAVTTPWQSGVQLNTVVTNVSYPGSNTGVFWTQNVLDFSGTSIQFIDNVWNFSSSGATMDPGTLYSYNGTLVPFNFYYAYGPTLPLSFPVTIDLYNNASHVGGRTTVTFGYRITEGITVFTGVYDRVVFNSRPTIPLPLLTADYLITGTTPNPAGLLYDAELAFGGPGGGSNAVINSLLGSIALQYRKGLSWTPARAAYDYGTDTGETAIGVAGTWSGATEGISQGPSMLYGLWNTTLGVPTGQDLFVANLNPTYGFAFVGPTGVSDSNLSYAPSAANGTAWSWLPPRVPPSLSYNLTAFADGFNQLNLTPILLPHAAYAVALVAHAGVWNAPLYMNGPAQAAALALDATGSAAVPYKFSGLVVHVNLTFNHLNDWGFPNFDLLWSNGVTTPFVVNQVIQGSNSPTGKTLYLQEFPRALVNLPRLGDEMAVWGGHADQFTNLTLPGVLTPIGVVVGGAVSLWQTPGVLASRITSTNSSFGIWAADSGSVQLINSVATTGAAALSVLASPNARAFNVSSSIGAAAVFDEGGTFGSFTDLNATAADGFFGFWANFTTFGSVHATGNAVGAILQFGSHTTVSGLSADLSSLGFEGVSLFATSVSSVSSTNGSTGAALIFPSYANVSGVATAGSGAGSTQGLLLANATQSLVSGVSANAATGVVADFCNGLFVSGVSATNQALGVIATGSTTVAVSGTSADGFSLGVVFESTNGSWVNATRATNESIGVGLVNGAQDRVNGVVAIDSTVTTPWLYESVWGAPISAVVTASTFQSTVANVAATRYPLGLADSRSVDLAVNNLNASEGDLGVMLNGTFGSVFSEVSAYRDLLGLQMNVNATSNVVASSRFVGDTGFGVDIESGTANTVYFNEFVGDNGASTSYDSTHIQAFSSPGNSFNSATDVGNYWADWHSYSNGRLNPYYVASGVWDYFPLGIVPGTFLVTFSESGLPSGTSWSVTVGATTQTTLGSSLSFAEPPGNYSFSVHPVSGWSISPSSGVVAVSTGPVGQTITFSAIESVWFNETGLPAGLSWSVGFAGVWKSTTTVRGTTSLLFTATPGVYAYQAGAVANYSASPTAGSVTVGSTGYTVAIAYTLVRYAVTITEAGLASGTVWSATVGGSTQFTATSTISFSLPNGSYAYQLSNVSGYSLSGGAGTIVVAGSPESAGGGYAPTSTPSYVPTSTFNTDLYLALGLAAAAIALALVALFRRPRGPAPAAPRGPSPAVRPAAAPVVKPSPTPAARPTPVEPWVESEEPSGPSGPGSGR